jgi:hypothetical protein
MTSLPEFPAFAPLDISHRGAVEPILAADPPEVSELNFAELFAWRGVRQTRITRLADSICMLAIRHDRRCFYPPVGGQDHPAVMRELLRWLRAQGEDGFVYGLTGAQAGRAAAAGGLRAVEDPDNADYVYRSTDLIHLAGHRYDGKRNHIRRFVRDYDFDFAPLDPSGLPEVMDFQHRWCAARGCAGEPALRDENRAVLELLEHFGQLDVRGATLRVEGAIQAFSVASPLNRDTALVVVEKANPELRGIYQAFNQMFCEKMLARYTWVNREQDAGDPGLRRAKLSYGPDHMVAKYRILLSV